MSANTGLDLWSHPESPMVVSGSKVVIRGEVAKRSNDLLSRMEALSIRRAIVCSDEPIDILRALDACDRGRVDLYVAHTNIKEHLGGIIESFAIQFRIGETDSILNSSSAGPEATGRVLMMTSGTTGQPKIATHSLASLLSRVRTGADAAANRDAKWLLTYQTTGFAGLQVLLTAALTRAVVVTAAQRTPTAFHEAAVQARVTHISATPTFWRSFLMVVSPSEVPLRQITLGGEATDQATLDRLKIAFPAARITHTYASTEAGVVYAVHDGLAGFPAAWLEQPNARAALRIRDGFLQIKSANAMRAYVNLDDQPFLDDGWLATADRCEVRGDRAYVIGRDDSTINVAGSKVYPLAVETFLLGLPGVVEAAVYGIPSPVTGFLVGADVVIDSDRDPGRARAEVLAACRERLPAYQVPRVLKIVAAISVGTSGKKSVWHG